MTQRRARLTEDEVRLIKAIIARGNVKQKWIASAMCVDPSLISLIASGKRWGHI